MASILSTKIASKISLALVAFGVVAVMSVVGAKPAMAKQHDINMWDACEYQYGSIMSVVSIADNVYGWRCHWWGSNGRMYGQLNLRSYCGHRYGQGAYYRNFHDKYSWYCG